MEGLPEEKTRENKTQISFIGTCPATAWSLITSLVFSLKENLLLLLVGKDDRFTHKPGARRMGVETSNSQTKVKKCGLCLLIS